MYQQLTVTSKLTSGFFFLSYQGSISSLLRSISSALCTVNGELINGDQFLFPGEKSGKSSRATSTQTFNIDIFTEEVIWICCITDENIWS